MAMPETETVPVGTLNCLLHQRRVVAIGVMIGAATLCAGPPVAVCAVSSARNTRVRFAVDALNDVIRVRSFSATLGTSKLQELLPSVHAAPRVCSAPATADPFLATPSSLYFSEAPESPAPPSEKFPLMCTESLKIKWEPSRPLSRPFTADAGCDGYVTPCWPGSGAPERNTSSELIVGALLSTLRDPVATWTLPATSCAVTVNCTGPSVFDGCTDGSKEKVQVVPAPCVPNTGDAAPIFRKGRALPVATSPLSVDGSLIVVDTVTIPAVAAYQVVSAAMLTLGFALSIRMTCVGSPVSVGAAFFTRSFASILNEIGPTNPSVVFNEVRGTAKVYTPPVPGVPTNVPPSPPIKVSFTSAVSTPDAVSVITAVTVPVALPGPTNGAVRPS